MTGDVLFFDSEHYWKYAYYAFMRERDRKRVGVEYSRRSPNYDRDFVRRILSRNTIVTFNGLGYDLPLVWYSLQDDVTPDMLKKASDGIIKGGLRYWEVEDFLGIRIPWQVKNNFVDLMEPQPNAFASLKTLNGRMHGNRLQDLPFDPDRHLSDDEMDIVSDYCLHSDLDATENLWNALQGPLEMRRDLGERYDAYFMCKSDAQIGEAIVKKRVEQITGRKIARS